MQRAFATHRFETVEMKFAAIILLLIVAVASIGARPKDTIWGDVVTTRLLHEEEVLETPIGDDSLVEAAEGYRSVNE